MLYKGVWHCTIPYGKAKEQLRKFLEEFDREDHERKDSEDDSDTDGLSARVSQRKTDQRSYTCSPILLLFGNYYSSSSGFRKKPNNVQCVYQRHSVLPYNENTEFFSYWNIKKKFSRSPGEVGTKCSKIFSVSLEGQILRWDIPSFAWTNQSTSRIHVMPRSKDSNIK